MTYTYLAILLASLVAALVALSLYRVISGSSRSVLHSRATGRSAKTTRKPAGRPSHAAARNLDQVYPAMTAMHRNPDKVWPYRERRTLDVGVSHKVRRRKPGESPAQEVNQAPWGW